MWQKRKDRGKIERKNPEVLMGLSEEEVNRRVAMGWGNKAKMPKSKTIGQIIASNIFTFFNLIFCILALCIILVGSWHNMLFMIVVVLNTFIGIIQEVRAKIVLDRLTVICKPTTTVIRAGKQMSIPIEDSVVDDIIYLQMGNQICADGIVRQGTVEVNEALLTGESEPILKMPGDLLLSGSYVVSGVCFGQLDKVGGDSYASQITMEARKHKKAHSEMMSSLECLIKMIAVLIIPFGIMTFFRQTGALGVDQNHAVITTVASMVGMIPEGLYLLTSIALAVGVVNLSKKNTLVHELYCIETLARVDIICLDKTGTITEGNVEVMEIKLLSEENSDTVFQALKAFSNGCSNHNETANALRSYFNSESEIWTVHHEIAFSSSRKWGWIDFGANGAYLLGAPEAITASVEILDVQTAQKLNPESRILLFGRCDTRPKNNIIDNHVIPLAYVVLADKIRRSAFDTFQYFKDQGVAIKVISGDNPLSVSNIAQRAGVEDADRYINANLLDSKETIRDAAVSHTVFGRVSPQQKSWIIEALQEAGHTVAMVGDGVNDVLALKKADCSVAMACGSGAAVNVAQLVLLDSNFESMPHIVKEGRRVINNIERSASLFLVKNIFSFIVSFVLLLIPLPFPFVPIQLTLLSSLTIGIPAFFLAFEPTYQKIQGHFIYNVMRNALPGGLTNSIIILTVLGIFSWLGISREISSMVCTIVAGCTGFTVLFVTCRPFSYLRRVLFTCLLLVFGFIMLVAWMITIKKSISVVVWIVASSAFLLIPPLVLLLMKLVDYIAEGSFHIKKTML